MTSIMSLIVFNGIEDINLSLQRKVNHSLGKDLEILFLNFLKSKSYIF